MSAQVKSEDAVPVMIPKNIYGWLNETAQRMGLTADDLASIILARFWEINRALTQPIPGMQVKPAEDLTNKLALIKEHKALVRGSLYGLTTRD